MKPLGSVETLGWLTFPVHAGTVAPPSRRLWWGRPAPTCEGKMPSRQPARCRRYGDVNRAKPVLDPSSGTFAERRFHFLRMTGSLVMHHRHQSLRRPSTSEDACACIGDAVGLSPPVANRGKCRDPSSRVVR